MGTNYKEILEQVQLEKQKASVQESKNVDNPTSIQASKENIVNLCVRVPKSWRTKVKAAAVSHDLTLEQLVVEAINQYMEQEGWNKK